MIFPSRADYSSTEECCSKAPLVFLGSSSDRTYKLVAQSHLAQAELIQMDIEMDNRVE